MSTNYWIGDDGVNNLKGVEGDALNPIRCADEFILYAIMQSQKARQDFNIMLPTLLPDEQIRLNDLLDANPFTKTTMVEDPINTSDSFQSGLNKAGVDAPRKRGGGIRPPQVY
jgi:hypothetical protein